LVEETGEGLSGLEEHDNDISVKMEQVALRENSHEKISLSVIIVSLQEMPLVNIRQLMPSFA
jgi:hypothetical protein